MSTAQNPKTAQKLIIKAAEFLLGRVFGNPGSPVSGARLRALLNTRTDEHARMLERVLEFSERQVKDVMVPRMEVTAIDINTRSTRCCESWRVRATRGFPFFTASSTTLWASCTVKI